MSVMEEISEETDPLQLSLLFHKDLHSFSYHVFLFTRLCLFQHTFSILPDLPSSYFTAWFD
jgi:hypothetical protein